MQVWSLTKQGDQAMNRLPKDKQIQVIMALTEGCSIRSIERMYDVHRDTITRLMVRTGQHCMGLMDDLMRDIPTGVYQCDEVWCFVRKKDKRLTLEEKHDPEIGSQFIWIAMEAETKLIPSWRVGKRIPEVAYGLMVDLADRMNGGRPTIITDGFGPYLDAVDAAFGVNVDFAQLIKVVSEVRKATREGYIPATVVKVRQGVRNGASQSALDFNELDREAKFERSHVDATANKVNKCFQQEAG